MKNIMMALMIAMMTTGLALAQEAGQKQAQAPEASEVYTTETVSGEVTSIGKKYISVVYNKDYDTGAEYEVMVPVTVNTVYKHVKELKDIRKGDLVSITYKKPVEGSKGMASAETVSFIQAGATGSGLVSQGVDISGATDSATPQSE